MAESGLVVLTKPARTGVRKIIAIGMKPPVARQDADGNTTTEMVYVSQKGARSINVRCSRAMFNRVKNKASSRDDSPSLARLADHEFLVGLEEQEDGTDLATSLDVLPLTNASFKAQSENEGHGKQKHYVFEVDQSSGSLRMLKAAHDGDDKEVRRIVRELDKHEELYAGLRLVGVGLVSSVVGSRVEISPQ